MDRTDDVRSPAELLHELKERAGLSYAALARATFTTSSTLHRYCTGRSVPRDYAVVAALARECGADAWELSELLRWWTAAIARRQRSRTHRTHRTHRTRRTHRARTVPPGPTRPGRPLRPGPGPAHPAPPRCTPSCAWPSCCTQQRSAERPPEEVTGELAAVNRVLHGAGVGTPLWITGPDYDIAYQPAPTGPRARDYAVRFYLMALYGVEQGVRRAYFYNWGGARIPVVLQGEGEPPTPAARAVDRLQQWLAGARLRGCGHGAAAGLPGNGRECRFVGPGPHGRPFVIRWAETGTATVPAGPGASALWRLDGTTRPLGPATALRLTGEPVLVRGAAAAD
ncbi:helix-turn-helix domain-containing protein [Streptomyces sp. NPDC004296]|uniref:helix-turn-helix domain-containing protein n=1 Tax=Streptomyces sp. NPDC004296 TaxID=3364697 RepID=UPI0036BE27E0